MQPELPGHRAGLAHLVLQTWACLLKQDRILTFALAQANSFPPPQKKPSAEITRERILRLRGSHNLGVQEALPSRFASGTP